MTYKIDSIGSIVGISLINYYSEDDVIKTAKMFLSYKNVSDVVIIDNGSDSEAHSLLAEFSHSDPRVRLISSGSNVGYAQANNIAIDALIDSGCSHIAIANNDIEISEDAFLAVVDELGASSEYAALAPTMTDAYGNKNPLRRLDLGYLRLFLLVLIPDHKLDALTTKGIGVEHKIVEQSYLPGSFFMARSEALAECGCFDPNTFLYREEEILGARLHGKGCKLGVLQDSTYKHLHQYKQESFSVLVKRNMLADQSERYFFKTYLQANRFQILYVRAMQLLKLATRCMFYASRRVVQNVRSRCSRHIVGKSEMKE